ncbi:MAG: M23 family metallopeptidase [Candidatus Nanopelagicales bacterium]
MQAWLPAHRGVDLRAHTRQRVLAPGPGTIVFTGRIADRPVVVMRWRGVRLTFEPVRAVRSVGAAVDRGEVIGRVGTGGHCGSTCLHWGAKVDGTYVDPLSFLPRERPVLKPFHP